MSDDGPLVPGLEKYGSPPSRVDNPDGWLRWRNNVWGDILAATSRSLAALADGLLDGAVDYSCDLTAVTVLDGCIVMLNNGRGFFMREAWGTASLAAADLLATLQAGSGAAGLAEAVERFLAESGGESG